MVLLIDTNVAVNYLTSRNDEQSAASKKVIELCAEGIFDGYIASHSIPIIWYILRKIPEQDRRDLLLDLCEVLTAIGANHEEIVSALHKKSFSDFEDCLQDKCAQGIDADYIVTCNIKDFISSEIPAVSPTELLNLI